MKKHILTLLFALLLVCTGCNDTQPVESYVEPGLNCGEGTLKIDETDTTYVGDTLKIDETDTESTSTPEPVPVDVLPPIPDDTAESTDLCGVPLAPVEQYTLTDEEKAAYFDLTLKLFKSSADPTVEENMMISPLSVLTALGMTANGAQNDTLTQIEDALGLPLDTLNAMLKSYLTTLPAAEKYKLAPANSIWYRDTASPHVNDEFLNTCKEFYDAEVRSGAFDDTTCDEINAWVNENTDGMITKLLDEIPSDAVMYLINALAFVAEWKDGYDADDVRDEVFTTDSGTQQTVPMMHSNESRYIYIDEGEYGFYKRYVEGKYAFAALLPPEGVTLDEYIAELTPEKLSDALSNIYGGDVNAALPKFESKFGIEMSGILAEMGMGDLFDSTSCDLSAMAQSDIGNLYVSRVLHSTYISVDEVGTKAAAVTAVEVTEACDEYEPIEITLDRPFVYMIVDCENEIPIFIGTVETFEG